MCVCRSRRVLIYDIQRTDSSGNRADGEVNCIYRCRWQTQYHLFSSSSTTRVKTKGLSYMYPLSLGLIVQFPCRQFLDMTVEFLFPLFGSLVDEILSTNISVFVGVILFRQQGLYFLGVGERDIEMRAAISMLLDTRSGMFIKTKARE